MPIDLNLVLGARANECRSWSVSLNRQRYLDIEIELQSWGWLSAKIVRDCLLRENIALPVHIGIYRDGRVVDAEYFTAHIQHGWPLAELAIHECQKREQLPKQPSPEAEAAAADADEKSYLRLEKLYHRAVQRARDAQAEAGDEFQRRLRAEEGLKNLREEESRLTRLYRDEAQRRLIADAALASKSAACDELAKQLKALQFERNELVAKIKELSSLT